MTKLHENINNDELQNSKNYGVKRIPSFISRLDDVTEKGEKSRYTPLQLKNYRDAVNALCKSEIAYMRRGLSDNDGVFSVQTLHRYISDYRNAVRDTYTGVLMPEIYTDKWGRKQPTHIAIKYLRMTKKERDKRKDLDIAAKDVYTDFESNSRLIISDPKRLINAIKTLLKSEKWEELAVGLMAATGRRPIEILSSANFTATDTNKCIFSGQAKSLNADKKSGFEIYTLAPAIDVVTALEQLRSIKNFKQLNNRQIESRTSGKLGIAVRKLLNDALEKPDLITPKSLRGIWVNIAHQLFKPMSIDTVFATVMLGHSTSNGQKSSGAAENYMQFYCYPFSRDEINDIIATIS